MPVVGRSSVPAPAAGGSTPATQVAPALTLDEAWRLANSANPTVQARQAQLAAAEGARTDAGAALYNNPQLTFENTRRSVPAVGAPTDRRSEWSAGVAQTFEVAGQRAIVAASEAALAALRAEIDDAHDNSARRSRKPSTACSRFSSASHRRGEAPSSSSKARPLPSRSDAAPARTASSTPTWQPSRPSGRATNSPSREQLLEAQAELATAAARSLRCRGRPGRPAAGASNRTRWRRCCLRSRPPRCVRWLHRRDSATSRLRLEESSRYPDVTVGLNVGREGPGDARERLTTLSVSVPLPCSAQRRRHRPGQQRAEPVRIEREAAGARHPCPGLHAVDQLQSLQARVRRLQESVLPALADNQQLSIKSQRAGQIGLLELIVVNRQALDARRDLVEALADLQTARFALEAAAGWNP